MIRLSRIHCRASPGVPIRKPQRCATSGSSIKCLELWVARNPTSAFIAETKMGRSAGCEIQSLYSSTIANSGSCSIVIFARMIISRANGSNLGAFLAIFLSISTITCSETRRSIRPISESINSALAPPLSERIPAMRAELSIKILLRGISFFVILFTLLFQAQKERVEVNILCIDDPANPFTKTVYL